MNDRERAIKLVNDWIAAYALFLKDGGGGGNPVHPKARDALVERIREALALPKPPAEAKPPAPPRNKRKQPSALGSVSRETQGS